MKILYTTDQIFLHGGIEKVLSQKASWFAENGDEVLILTYNQQGRKPVYPFSGKIQMMDLGIDYDISKSYFHQKNLRKIPLHISKLKTALKDIQPDVLISSNFGPDSYFLPFIAKEIPKIKEYHSSRFYESTDGFKNKILKALGNFAENNYGRNAVLNPSEKEFYKGRISVIPNPAELSEYRAGLSSKKMLAAGRISPVKNFGELIRIFADIAPEFPEWQLHFFGQDYLGTQAKLEDLIAEKKLQSQVKFLGQVQNLKETMQDYSIYAMTSETECFPMVLLEALSVGMPVISYDVPTGPKHIITNEKDGYLIPQNDTNLFAEKLKTLMQDESLRRKFSENALQNILRFETESVMQQWKKLLKDYE